MRNPAPPSLLVIAAAALLAAGAGHPAPATTAAPAAPHEAIAATDPAATASFDADTVVALVDGVPLTLADLFLRFAALPSLGREQYASGGGLRQLLDDTVASVAIAREAEQQGLARDPLYAQLLSLRREEVLRDLYARHTVLAQIDDATLRRRYDEQKESRFRRPAAARLRQVLVTPVAEAHPFSPDADAVGDEAARAKAERLRAEIAAGAEFAAVARRGSEDVTAAQGGAIGWVRPGQLVAPVDALAFSLAPGQLSPVVASPLGYHLLLVEERIDGGVVPFEAVRELLFQELVAEQADTLSRAARQDRERVLQRHRVETHPERLP